MSTISIEQLKPLGTKVASELNRDREPLEELRQVVKFADEVLKGATFKDSKTAAYFYDDFLGAVSKAALKTYRFRDHEMVELVKLLSLKMTLLFAKMIDTDNHEYVQRMRYVLDPGMTFYREYGLKSAENFTLQVHAEEVAGWREALQKGDYVDILKKEPEGGLKGWTTGIVAEKDKDTLTVQLECEPDISPVQIPVNSRELAPYGCYTGKNGWRKTLAKGDIVDCIDSSGNWYQSTILATDCPETAQADKVPPKIKIGYRTYIETGSKKDEDGKFYQGWSQTYDEWIKTFSLRVQPRGTLSKRGLIMCRKGVDEFDKEAVDDASDIMMNSVVDKETYCVLRPDKTSCETVVHLLNVLGAEGGFDKILTRFQNKEKPMSFELAYYYFDIIGIVWNHLHRRFANRYIPALQAAIIAYFQTAPDVEIRKVQKERFEKTLKNLDSVLRRVYTVLERASIMEHFELSICTTLLKSEYLQRRIDGLKGINDICKNVGKKLSKSLTPAFFGEWIIRHGVVDELLGPKKHSQLLQRSAQILAFMYEYSLLDHKILESIWNNTRDEQFQQDTFQVIKEIGFLVGSPELQYFVDKIAQMPPDTICEAALDVVYEAHRGMEKAPELLFKYADIMWGVVIGEGYSMAMSEKALSKYAGMVSGLEFEPHKKNIMGKCIIDMLGKNENSVMALKLLKRLVNQYSAVLLVGATHTRGMVIDTLLTSFDLLRVFFTNFENYYKSAKSSPPTGRHTHTENITERIEFLNYIVTNATSSAKLSLSHLDTLWEMLCESPVSKEDSQVLFKFLKDLAPDQATYARNLSPAEGKRFFEEKICGPKTSFEGLTVEAFGCITQFFNLVNEHEGLITVSRVQTHKHISYTSYSNVAGAAYNEYSFNKKDETGVAEVRTKVHPAKLHGTETFWRIVQEADNKDVVEKARDFLNKLYTMLAGELESKASEIRGAFIETYLEKLGSLITSSSPKKTQMIARMISLMMEMIDESERKGTGRLKSHSALLKGPLLSFIIHNNVTSGKTVPKKLEVEAYANTTIWELKAELGKYIESSPECIKLAVGSKEVKDTDHGKTIGEFMEKRSGVLRLEKKNMDDIPKVPLLTEDQKLTEKARAAFTDIFNKFAKDGKMDNVATALFIQSTTGETTVRPDDDRIKGLMMRFDTDKDGMMDVEGFLEFYRDAAADKREDTVRHNLGVHGFRNDLKKLNEVEEIQIDITTLPRHILSCNPRSFELLFRILDMGDHTSGEQTWSLISRLATNESMYNQLLGLNIPADEKGNLQWEKLIDTHSTYRLLYSLQIIESFLEETDPAAGSYSATHLKKSWQKNFISKGGFEFLLSAFLNQDPTKGLSFAVTEKMDKFEKECAAFLGTILNSFIRTATYTANEKLKADLAKLQPTLKRKMEADDTEVAVVEEPVVTTGILKNSKTKDDEGKIKEKAKEPQVDLAELFKSKPSTILFLKSSATLKHSDSAPLESADLDKSSAGKILSQSISKSFWTSHLTTLCWLTSRETLESVDSEIAASALHLFTSCVLIDSGIFFQAKGFDSNGVTFDKLILRGVLCEKSQTVREEFADALYFLCCSLKEESPLGYILGTMLENIPQKKAGSNCGEYFKLLGKLVDIHYESPKDGFELKPEALLKQLAEMLKKHRTSEKRNSAMEDKLLVGIMKIIRKILSHEPGLKESMGISEGLLQEVFFNCLFPTLTSGGESLPTLAKAESQEVMADAQKCKTKESRTAAYKLLATLCGGNLANQSYLVRECLEPLCKSIKSHNGWAYVPSSESRSKLGYSGIENLGCICYMNAMVQQFYMIPTLRYALLGADDKRPPAIKKPSEIDDNVLHQFQRIFAFLEMTERQDYNPAKFCHAFKDLDGRPTNTTIQQDAQEFLNLLFDRLENLLKETPDKYLLQSVFGGKTCSQLICKGGCGSVRRNYEDFYNLSVGVRGYRTLAESLNKFISGDTISGFNCEGCGKKVDVVKRTCIDQLPNVLIIHLQRLLYNYDTQMNEKINTRLEFPKEFSIEPYTVEGVEAREKAAAENGKSPVKGVFLHGRDPEYYEYKLAGVVVHVGMAEAGHYYSYINTNRKRSLWGFRNRRKTGKIGCEGDSEKDLFDPSKDLWLEFNDSHIRNFDISKLESECFGGSSENQKESSGFSFRMFDFSSIKNAYMLVYERKLKTPLKKLAQPQEIELLLASGQKALECENTALARVGQIYHDPKKNEYLTFTNFYDVKPRLPPGLYQEVWEDNSTFLFERQIYSADFFQFAQDIFNKSYALLPTLPKPASDDISGSITRICAKVVYDVLAHAYDNANLKPITDQLVQLFQQSEAATKEFLEYVLQGDMKETLFILTKCPDKDVRVSISRLITEVLLAAIAREGEKALSYEIEVQDRRQIFHYKSDAGRVMHHMLESVNNELGQNWPRFEQFFAIIYAVAKKGGDHVLTILNKRRVVAFFIDFYLGTESPLYEIGEKRPTMGNKCYNPKFQSLINLVSLLAMHADLTFWQPNYPTMKAPKKLYDFCEEEKKCLQCKEFLMKTVIEGYATAEFSELLGILCYESKKFSKELAKMLLKAINENPNIDMAPYFTVLRGVLTIEDSLQQKRLEWLLGIPVPSKAFTQLAATAKPHEQFKYGLHMSSTVHDEITEYISPLNYNTRYESLLSLLWKSRSGSEIHPVKCLLELMTQSPKVFRYVTELPPPTYRYAKYPDWIRPAVAAYPTNTRSFGRFSFFSSSKKGLAAYPETVKLLKEYEKLWEDFVAKQKPYTDKKHVLLAFPQPYLIGKSVDEKVLLTETKDDVTVVMSEVTTEIFESLPTGEDNLGIPPAFFEKQRDDALKAYHEKMLQEEVKVQPVTEEKPKTPAWKTEPTILKIEIRSTSTKFVKVKLIFAEKEGKANFQVPTTGIATILDGQKRAILYLATKRTLGTGWGDFSLVWKAAVKEMKRGKKNVEFESPEIDMYSYCISDDDDEPYGKEFGTGTSDEGIRCGNCKFMNGPKAEKCTRCGEILEDMVYY